MGSMYYQSRSDAGKQLAQRIAGAYDGVECAVIALSEGGVIVGMHIAASLGCSLNLLLVDPVEIPGEAEPVGAVSATGTFAFNKMYAPGEIEELIEGYRGAIEDGKRTRLSKLHQLTGSGDSVHINELQSRHLILVSDGFKTGYSIDIAIDVLKPVTSASLSVAAPLISSEAIDRARVQCDRMFYLQIVDNYLTTDQYYEEKDVPDREQIIKLVKEFVVKTAVTADDATAVER